MAGWNQDVRNKDRQTISGLFGRQVLNTLKELETMTRGHCKVWVLNPKGFQEQTDLKEAL